MIELTRREADHTSASRDGSDTSPSPTGDPGFNADFDDDSMDVDTSVQTAESTNYDVHVRDAFFRMRQVSVLSGHILSHSDSEQSQELYQHAAPAFLGQQKGSCADKLDGTMRRTR